MDDQHHENRERQQLNAVHGAPEDDADAEYQAKDDRPHHRRRGERHQSVEHDEPHHDDG